MTGDILAQWGVNQRRRVCAPAVGIALVAVGSCPHYNADLRAKSDRGVPMTWADRITFDPVVMGGKPCIRGMRVTVGMIVALLAAGRTEAEILEAYPYLEAGDLRAALSYAAWRAEERDVPLAGG